MQSVFTPGDGNLDTVDEFNTELVGCRPRLIQAGDLIVVGQRQIVTPRSAARATSSSGVSVPSEQLE